MNSGGNRPPPPRRKRRTGEKLHPAVPGAASTPAPKPAVPAKPPRPDRGERPATPAQALERLRARIGDAVRELERLRAENELLAQRVAELEVSGGRTPDVVLPFADTPEALRDKMDEFIDALDAFLALDGGEAPAPMPDAPASEAPAPDGSTTDPLALDIPSHEADDLDAAPAADPA